ncbi:MAG TPA: sulfatase [Blastocatellia bacterium]|nr:sulfatase [Blastocatellia bacterium]HMV83653.1 sulfatase [Blastocatellia bacterium]HMX24304.1 sulfatase [Blastocatellia bacterium]HMZ20588.1 sulfatase [Blastocatellia bacterium]HNG34572.1 sulfatase [Blastocatellia bacterium]
MQKTKSTGSLLTLACLLLACAAMLNPCLAQTKQATQNFVVILCDDLGYGDVGAFGNPTIRTPNLDRMAAEGQRWTSFYVADSVCTPSRSALLTGRLPIRTGMYSDTRRVLFPDSADGLPSNEITIAELLKTKGYATTAIGKWHLGRQPEYLPIKQGFDSYFGIPYSNDMDATFKFSTRDEYVRFMKNPKLEYWNVPLMRGDKIIERPANQNTITERYTDEAIKFINANKNKPFFVYLAHSMPHMPLFRSKKFENKSIRGLYGDVIEELDANVGRVLDTLRKLKLDSNTLVVFTSDNGPWALFDEQGGSAGLLRGAKGGTYEGGMREPTIFWQPGTIKPSVVTDIGSTLDLLQTFCALTGIAAPSDRVLDGYDISPVLLGKSGSSRQTMFYWRGSKLYAVRHGAYKAHFITKSEYGTDAPVTHATPELYNLDVDPSEKWDIAAQHPEVVAEIRRIADEHKKAIPPVTNHLDKRITAPSEK